MQQAKFEVGQFDFDAVRIEQTVPSRVKSMLPGFDETEIVHQHGPTASHPGEDFRQRNG
jgi:hypothetical protein